jgi:hypothetical protein
MSINLPPRPPQPPSATALAAGVLDRLGLAVRRAQLVAVVHEVDGCPAGGPGGGCRPCEAEQRRQAAEVIAEHQRRRVEQDRRAVAQHAVSAKRLAALSSGTARQRHSSPAAVRAERRRLAYEANLIAATHRVAPGALCRVCHTTLDGKVCRRCDPAGLAPPPGSPERPLGVARSDRQRRRLSPAEWAAVWRTLDSCPGCRERGTGGKVCGPCAAGV